MSMSEWKEVTIGEISILKNGRKRPTKKGNVPVYGGNGIMDSVNTHNEEDCIAIGRVGAYCGCVYLAKGKVWISDNAISAKANENADNVYLYYLLSSLNLNRHRIGGAQPLMTQDLIGRIKVQLPPIEEQHRIASILSNLDDKIAVNRRICENLEAQAQALFKHWFIDFAPFKDGKFVASELGMIPEGWKVGTLGEIAEFKRGKTITKENTKEGNIPVVAGGLEPAYYHNESNTSSRVITISGSGANAGFTRMYYVPVWASDCSFVDSASTSFLHTAYCYLLSNKKKVDALQWGAAQPHVYAKDINKLPLTIAPFEVLIKFEELVVRMFDSMEIYEKENLRLSTLRDTLLPKLMSGQIKV